MLSQLPDVFEGKSPDLPRALFALLQGREGLAYEFLKLTRQYLEP